MKPASISELSNLLKMFFSVYPMQDTTPEMTASRLAIYLDVLVKYPFEAVRGATQKWLNGQGLTGKENFGFAPTPPQLCQLAEREVFPIRKLKHQCQALLDAKVEEPVIISAEERERRSKFIDGLVGDYHHVPDTSPQFSNADIAKLGTEDRPAEKIIPQYGDMSHLAEALSKGAAK